MRLPRDGLAGPKVASTGGMCIYSMDKLEFNCPLLPLYATSIPLHFRGKYVIFYLSLLSENFSYKFLSRAKNASLHLVIFTFNFSDKLKD